MCWANLRWKETRSYSFLLSSSFRGTLILALKVTVYKRLLCVRHWNGCLGYFSERNRSVCDDSLFQKMINAWEQSEV